MKSLTTPDFWQAYSVLPLSVKKQAQKAYQIWLNNQSYPSLHFKKVGKNKREIKVARIIFFDNWENNSRLGVLMVENPHKLYYVFTVEN
jgi:hypothetical protein